MSIDDKANKPKRPFGRSLGNFANLSEAEKKLIACAAHGEVCKLGEAVPKEPTLDNVIRPELIRFLALGGDEDAPVHEKGVKLVGAYIGAAAGEKPRALDLEGAQLLSSLWLIKSRFQHRPNFRETQGKSLSFAGSAFPGLRADRLKLGGRLFLERTISIGELKLGGAEINGSLSCKGARFENKRGVSFFCDRAKIGGSVFLSENFTAIGRVRLNGVEIGAQLAFKGGNFINKNDIAISCNSAKIGGSVFYDGDFHAIGSVSLSGAVINGNLNCTGGRFENEGGAALSCNSTKISGSVFCDGDFHAIGSVSLSGAVINGNLYCRGGRIENEGGAALSCNSAKIGGSVFCDMSFYATGEVSLIGITISGNLACRGGCFENIYGFALVCDGARIGGDIFLDALLNPSIKIGCPFQAIGEVRLIGANVGGDLVCRDGRFENESHDALCFDRAMIGGNVYCDGSFLAIGRVSCSGTNISGDLCCTDGRYENKDGKALNFDRSKVGGEVFCDGNFHALGIVSLIGADIGASLSCRGGRFENGKGVSLICDWARIKNSLFCDFGFYSTGEVHLQGVNINNDLICEGSRLDNEGARSLTCDGAVIGGKFNFRGLHLINGYISLAHSSIGTLEDDVNCWPAHSLILDGFRYERVDAFSPLDAKSRIAWLDKQKPKFLAGNSFALQPWMQLAKVLREQGHFREAADVDIAREERLRAAGKIGDPKWGQIDSSGSYITFLSSINEYLSCFYHWLHGLLTGYGYQPWRIIYIATFLWLFGACVFYEGADNGSFAPTNAAAKTLRDQCKNQFKSEPIDWLHCAALQETYPRFSPLAYSLDLILPVVRLGQSAAWTPTWDAVWTQRIVWVEEIFGWVAALTLAAIAAGLVKRKDG